MDAETLTVRAVDGTQLAIRRWAREKPIGVVQIVHGMAEHSGRYSWLAGRLVAAGFEVWACDHRGHGMSGGELLHLDGREGWSAMVRDVAHVGAMIGDRTPGRPRFLLGHSMGSTLARCLVAGGQDRPSGLVLSGVSADPGVPGSIGLAIAGLERRLRGSRHRSRLMTRLTFGRFSRSVRGARTRFDWLTRESVRVDDYVGDPLCGGIATAGFFCVLLGGVRTANREATVARIDPGLPVLILAGDRDPVGGMGRGARMVADQLKRRGMLDVRLRMFAGARHEVFNEIDRDDVASVLVAWLGEHSASRGG